MSQNSDSVANSSQRSIAESEVETGRETEDLSEAKKAERNARESERQEEYVPMAAEPVKSKFSAKFQDFLNKYKEIPEIEKAQKSKKAAGV